MDIYKETIATSTAAENPGVEFTLPVAFGGVCAILHEGTVNNNADLQVKVGTQWHTHVTDVPRGEVKTATLFPGTWRFVLDDEDPGSDHTLSIRKAFYGRIFL